MTDKINALVVGAGGFGEHHARILSYLDYQAQPDLPIIDTLAVSRTSLPSAEAMAETLSRDDRCTASRIVPVHIDSVIRLQRVLAELSPQFISICARDRQAGDTVHAAYASAALPYGAVLCEKPFSEATGDGRSLMACHALFNEANAARFGLELPMAVVVRNMLRRERLRNWFARAGQVQIVWTADIRRKNMLVDDLALHPWSLLHPMFEISVIRMENSQTRARIDLELKHRRSGRRIDGRITLKNRGSFRGIGIDDTTIVFENSASGVKLIRLAQPLEAAARIAHARTAGQAILQVENPLTQNILAVLRQRPVVGLRDTCASQLFLERLHGYFPP